MDEQLRQIGERLRGLREGCKRGWIHESGEGHDGAGHRLGFEI